MRTSGLLLHPTSLPSDQGIGVLGPQAHAFVDQLSAAGQRVWQILPLGPTGQYHSPYMTSSAFAGNPLLIDLHDLKDRGLLSSDDLALCPKAPAHTVDFDRLVAWKSQCLSKAWNACRDHTQERRAIDAWRAQQDSAWLEEFAHFTALSRAHDGRGWHEWPTPLRDRHPDALALSRTTLRDAIDQVVFEQATFARQWDALKHHAQAQDVQIMGDIPIFVSFDSADVWAHPELFFLDPDTRLPSVVAGVPPDYFSATGQRWGNPLYRWDAMAQDGFAWWVARFAHCFTQVDQVRIDHFRGFEAYWEIPADAPDATSGSWKPGPGAALFEAVRKELGDLAVVAEDLGIITPEVEALRDGLNLPGMKILQFAFGDGPHNAYLPHNFASPRCVAYTGTHDNNTTRGWYDDLPEKTAHHVRVHLSASGHDIAWDLIRNVWMSTAELAIAPVQDVLSLGAESRMNTPGKADGNWAWRMERGALNEGLIQRLRLLTDVSGRLQGESSL